MMHTAGTDDRSTCAYGSMLRDKNLKHGPIVGKFFGMHSSNWFDVCDLHLQLYRNNGYEIKLNYKKDISSDAAVSRRKQSLIGNNGISRTRIMDTRKDLL